MVRKLRNSRSPNRKKVDILLLVLCVVAQSNLGNLADICIALLSFHSSRRAVFSAEWERR